MKTIAISGSTGFIGSALVNHFEAGGYHIIKFKRAGKVVNEKENNEISISDFTKWGSALERCNTFIHCAGLAHIADRSDLNTLDAFRKINVDLTLKIANQAALSGVKKFIFISSIGVNGQSTDIKAFNNEDNANPYSFYTISKYEAELGLWDISQKSAMKVVVIRPPLIYGRYAPGNFRLLLRAIKLGFLLPFGSITDNRRSFLSLENLIDLVARCVEHPNAENKLFLASDCEDISTAEFCIKIGAALGVQPKLVPIQPELIRIITNLIKKESFYKQVCCSLQIDSFHTQNLLEWKPPFTIDASLKRIFSDIS